MLGDLPPSSSETFLSVPAAAAMTFLPVAVEPVKAILSTSGEVTRALPATAPLSAAAVTTLTTPAGAPASRASAARARTTPEARCDGLITVVQPAARAGASFHETRTSGKFQ